MFRSIAQKLGLAVTPHYYSKLYRTFTGYDRKLRRLVQAEVKNIRRRAPDDSQIILLDCGANEGNVLSAFAYEIPDGEFHAFEVQQELVERIKRKVPMANVRCAAVSDTDGTVSIYLPKKFGPNFRGGTSILNTKIHKEDCAGSAEVASVRLASEIKLFRAKRPDAYLVVKMDIEGAEYRIIDDLYQLYRNSDLPFGCIDRLIIEFHQDVAPESGIESYKKKLKDMGVGFAEWL